MEEIILRQRNAAKPLTGKAFLLSIAGILLRLAIAQIIVNLLISATGLGLINLLFYLYSVLLLLQFMRGSVASYVYTLKENMLILEKKMGDSTFSVLEIPLERIVSMRPVKRGERLKTTYRQVTAIDPETKPSLRMRMAFRLSLVSARLARLCAGKGIGESIGSVLIFTEDEKLRACTFRPDEKMCEAIVRRIGSAYGFDERMTHARADTLYARALERAFPQLYPYVEPLLRSEDVDQAKAEIAARSEAEKKKRADQAAKGKKAKAKAHTEDDNRTADAQTPVRRRRKQG